MFFAAQNAANLKRLGVSNLSGISPFEMAGMKGRGKGYMSSGKGMMFGRGGRGGRGGGGMGMGKIAVFFVQMLSVVGQGIM